MTKSNDTKTPEGIITKIEALFRQANHENTGEAERKAFHAKALALMEKHRITHVNVDVDPNEEPERHVFGDVKGSYAGAHHQIIASVCDIYGCQTMYQSSGRPGDPTRMVWIFGFKADADRVQTLSHLFIEDAKGQAASYKSSSPNHTIKWRKSFMMGYAAEIAERYREAAKLLKDDDTNADASTALVLVSRKERVDDAFDKIKKRTQRSNETLNSEGYRAGQSAARNSNVGRARIGNNCKALN